MSRFRDYELLKLDSDLFGFPTGRIIANNLGPTDLQNTLEAARSDGICLLYLSIKADDPHCNYIVEKAQLAGDHVEGKVVYFMELSKSLVSAVRHSSSSRIVVEEFLGPVATPQLIKLALSAGESSRFIRDKNINAERFEALYEAWMRNSVAKQAADIVLVARTAELPANEVAGLITIRNHDSQLQVCLMAVTSQHRRSGIGKALMSAAYEWGLNQGKNTLTVATEACNMVARKFYESCGGILMESSNEIHFWLSQTPFKDPIQSEIPNCKPYIAGAELQNIQDLFESRHVQTHFKYGVANQKRLEKELGCKKVLLVGSGTQALELCSFTLGVGPGDEVIMPSYTFVSTANAFVSHGAVPVFVDIRGDTQNIDEKLIEEAITERTKAICVVHYAGIPCEMDSIMDIANRHNLFVIEDNAHGIFGSYKGRMLGTIGDVAAVSFHYTKNIICGEGGAMLINNASVLQTAMVAWEKGTNRFDFLQGRIDKYAWVGKGGSFVMSEISAAMLAGQLEARKSILTARVHVWNSYHAALEPLEKEGKLCRPHVPDACVHNGHIYYIRVPDRERFLAVGRLAKQRKVGVFTHYEPLHSSTGGLRYARMGSECPETTACAMSLYRLPLWVGLNEIDIARVIAVVKDATS